MSAKTLRTWSAAIAVVLAVVVAWSITANNFMVPLITIVLAMGLTYVLRRRTKGVTKDERTTLLVQKAAVSTIRICIPIMSVLGIILFFFARTSVP